MLKRKEIEGYQYFRLDNGIKLIHRQNSAPVSHLALMVNTGSRDEDLSENGVAHLIEHMIFKGTNKRKAFHVISFLENVGCDLNAYTTKEETCIHGTFLKAYYDRALELFADIAFNSVFPAKELEKEKEVILDEINSYKDSPSEEIFDEYENMLFSGHPIGRNILGTTDTVKSFNRNHILRFIKKKYKTSEIVISSVGNIDFEKLKKHVSRHFGLIPASDNTNHRQPFDFYLPRTQKEERDNYLSHCLIGNIAYQYDHPKKHSLVLLNNVLGGPGLNSRLNLNIREKYGFAYNIDSQYTSYTDTGWFGVYLGTDPESVTKAESLVKKELKKLCNDRLGTLQLARAKQQLIVQLAISIESGLTETLSIARAHLQKDHVDSMEDIIRSIRNIDSSDLLEVANEVFEPRQLSTLIFAGNKS
jgi:predicted Zn-dependent peptidase